MAANPQNIDMTGNWEAAPSACLDSLTPDLEAAGRFLQLLDPTGAPFTFQVFDDTRLPDGSKRGHAIQSSVRHGALADHAAFLASGQRYGFGAFVMVNAGDGKTHPPSRTCRAAESVTRIRALFQEDDGDGRELPLEPHIIVSSSPGKFHRYLLVEGLSKEEFNAVMQVMVERYGSDRNAKDIARVLRLPGFWNLKYGDPYQVRVIHESDAPPYTPQQVLAAFEIDPATIRERARSPANDGPVERTAPQIITDEHRDIIAQVALQEARRTMEDPAMGRSHAIFRLANHLRRDLGYCNGDRPSHQAEEAITQLALDTFEQHMRPTDTTGKVAPMNWPHERKTFQNGWNRDTKEPDLPGTNARDRVHAAFAAGGGASPGPGDPSEDGPDSPPSSGELDKARVMARRSAINGEDRRKTVGRLAKQWPGLKDQAEAIVTDAHAWLAKLAPGKLVKLKGIDKAITSLSQLNRRFCQLDAKGRATCVIHRPDGLPITHQDFAARVAGEVVLTGVDSKGMPAFTTAAEYWRGSCRKHRFTEIVFTRNPTGDHQYNLFTGFGVAPSTAGEAGCRLILGHIHEVICGGRDEDARAFISLLAWQVQNIGRPSRIITALYSQQQQVGKGVLLEHILLPIFGPAGLMTGDAEHGLGRFNDALRGRAYLFMDEAHFAKDRRLADKLKGLCAQSTIAIEAKGLPITITPSGLNLYLATNHQEVAHVETADARYWILHVAEHRKGDHAYFADLEAEISSGGLEAFLGVLLARDVANFHPQRDVPRDTDALTQAKSHSRNEIDCTRWLEECIDAGQLLGVMADGLPGMSNLNPIWSTGDKYSPAALHAGYRTWAGNVRSSFKSETARQEFWRVLSAVGFRHVYAGRSRWRVVPDIEAADAVLNGIISGEVRA